MRTCFLPASYALLIALGCTAVPALSTPASAGALDSVQGVLNDTLGTKPNDGTATVSGTASAPVIRQSTVDQVLSRNPVPARTASTGPSSTSPSPQNTGPAPCNPADPTDPCRTPDTSLNAVLSGHLVQRVYFLRNSATLDESGKADLVNLARLYSRRIGDLVLVGSTQKTPGGLTETDQLGLERALAVEAVLQQNGIVPSRLRVAEAAASDGVSGDYVDIRLDGY